VASPAPGLTAGGVVGRELGIKETVSLSLRLYRRNFASFVVVFVTAGVGYGLIGIAANYLIPLQASNYFSSFSDFIISPSALLQSLIFTAVASPIHALSDGAGTSLAVDTLNQEHADLKQSYRTAMSKLKLLLLVTLLTGFIVDFASIVELVDLIPMILFFVVIPVVIIETNGTWGVISRSRQLVSKRWGKVFELFVVFGVISAVPTFIIFYAFPYQSPTEIMADSIWGGFAAPILVGMTTAFYYSSLARLSAPGSPASTLLVQSSPRLWICQNCGKSIILSAKPKDYAFGGCEKGRKLTFTVPKHKWVESTTPVQSS